MLSKYIVWVGILILIILLVMSFFPDDWDDAL